MQVIRLRSHLLASPTDWRQHLITEKEKRDFDHRTKTVIEALERVKVPLPEDIHCLASIVPATPEEPRDPHIYIWLANGSSSWIVLLFTVHWLECIDTRQYGSLQSMILRNVQKNIQALSRGRTQNGARIRSILPCLDALFTAA